MLIKLSLIAIFLLAQQVSSFRIKEFLKREGGSKGSSSDCVDVDPYCKFYGSDACIYFKKECKKTCNLCRGTTPVEPTAAPTATAESKDCVDVDPYCKFYGSDACTYFKDDCKKTCNLCGGTNPVPATVRPRPVETTAAPTAEPNTAPTAGQATPESKGSSNDKLIKSVDDACLNAHNEYRAQHSAPPLKLNKDLIKSSEEYAVKLTGIGDLQHSVSGGKYGENLYYFGSSNANDDPSDLCKKAVKAWYDEIKDYDFSKPGFSQKTGHFTQVVWKGSQEVGMGIAKIFKDGFYNYYAVAQYTPAGNLLGAFAENVLPSKINN